MRHDVAVIGCGPTGATLANLLAECGLRVLVIDREPTAYHLPRAVHFDDETMRVFQTVGIADALSEKTHVNPGMRFVDTDGTLLLDWPRPQEPTPMGWHASYRLHQPDLEALLRDRLAQRPGVTLRMGCRIETVEEMPDHVRLTGTDRATGEACQFSAGWVVGCDGANSMLRDAIGGGMEDLGFRERWLVVDVLLKRPRPDLGDHTIQFCDPARPMTYCRSPGIRRRWEIAVQDDEDDAAISAESNVWRLLSRWITPEDATLERRAVYTFHSALARNWRRDRLMIAGDAAHLTPPFMGQGMCTGIRDAANLAWKLAQVARGEADAALLDTYQAERAPHARHYIETAIRLGGLINAMDRDAALQLARDGGRFRSIAPALGPSARLTPHPSGRVGTLFPQPVLADGTRLDDYIGYAGFVLTALPGAPPADPALCLILRDIGALGIRVGPDRQIEAISDDPAEIRGWHAPHRFHGAA